eukprot:3499889-Amphidinium_carterae.1
MRAMSKFSIHINRFKGTIPESGIRMMRRVTTLAIYKNSFEGALPESGLQVMRIMSVLFVQENHFAGTLPNRAVVGLGALSVSNNDFEGKLSQTQYEQCEVASFVISESVNLDRCNTLISESTGSLPQPQLAGRANSTELAWRQRAGPKMRGSQSLSLRASHMSA